MNALRQKIRVGVVGIGFGQQVHVPAFRANKRCEVAVICASSEERAHKVAESLQIPEASGDWEALVRDSGLDAISIATPPALQAEIAIAALQAGKAVFCEKPVAVDRDAAVKMVHAAQGAGLPNMVDFEFPEIECWQTARKLLLDGAIGSLQHVQVSWYVETYANRMGLDSWKTQAAAGGGTLSAFVSHVFYALEWFCGPVRRLSAGLYSVPGDERPGDTLATLNLELNTGVPVSISVSSQASFGSGHRIDFYGSDGRLMLENRTQDYMNGFELWHGDQSHDRMEKVLSSKEGTEAEDGRLKAVGHLVDRFVEWIDAGQPQRPDFANGLRVQTLIDAARASHASGCRVEVSDCG